MDRRTAIKRALGGLLGCLVAPVVVDKLLTGVKVTVPRILEPPKTSVFYFGPPKFIGKNYTLESTKMTIRREAFKLEGWTEYRL
jgi:hypothetical protein